MYGTEPAMVAEWANGLPQIQEEAHRRSQVPIPNINQLNTQIKLTEMWKALNKDNYPIEITKLANMGTRIWTRGMTNDKVIEPVTM